MTQYNYITETGLVLVDTSDLQAQVESEWKSVFGQDLITTPNTPQGLAITAEVAARDAVMRNNAAVANQINPNMAGGVFLDAIWALTNGQRIRANSTLVPGCIVTGVPGQTLPAGAQASVGVGGPLFETTSSVRFAGDGTATVSFQSLDFGPIAAPPGELNTIAQGVIGWETVTNPNAATLGLAQEKDPAARVRRRNTLAIQGVGLAEGVRGQLLNTTGVVDVKVFENFTGAPKTQDGVTIPEHTLYSCVDGGTDADVAATLLSKKSLGCNWSGAVTVEVLNAASGQLYPVSFDRPTFVPIFMAITLRAATSISDPANSARQAVIDYAAGAIPGLDGFLINGSVSPFEIGAAIAGQFPALLVLNVLIGTAPGALSTNVIAMNLNQKASVVTGNIAVNLA